MMIDFMARIHHFWTRLAGPSYVHWLEEEIARLRAENRALMNSILGVAGIPPVITHESDGAVQENPGAPKAPTSVASAQPVAPLRRRSWQQIHRSLEIQAAQKKDSNGSTSF